MDKKKIEIESIFRKILFSYECYSVKEAVIAAVIHGANLYSADLSGANLRCANLYSADLHGADLYGADLSGASLRCANLYSADLSGANLRCANLSGANLHGADLYGADLSGASLHGADLSGANLHGAKIIEILNVGPIGSRRGYTTIYNTDQGIKIQCGCFFGTEEEFIAKVKATHQDNDNARHYLAMLEFAKIRFNK